jgi:hypothetical protein
MRGVGGRTGANQREAVRGVKAPTTPVCVAAARNSNCCVSCHDIGFTHDTGRQS